MTGLLTSRSIAAALLCVILVGAITDTITNHGSHFGWWSGVFTTAWAVLCKPLVSTTDPAQRPK